jgi:hypothetical protein
MARFRSISLMLPWRVRLLVTIAKLETQHGVMSPGRGALSAHAMHSSSTTGIL